LLDQQTIALDALTAHLHPTNPISSISLDQISSILAGNFSNWAQVGGDDATINLHVLDESSNLARIIARDLLNPQRLRISRNATVHESLAALNAAVASDPLGFAVSYRSDSNGTNIPSTRNSCNIFSSPDTFSLQTEEYPLTMRWHLYSLTTSENADYALRFAEYLQSDEGQSAAEAAGLVGLAIAQQRMSDQGERLLSAMLADTVSNAGIRTYQNYLKEVSTGYRLSATMRFYTGSSQLDARSIRDWERVSKLISSGMMDGNNLMLVGFTDSIGNFAGNVNLSISRAEYVKSVILQENAGVLFSDDVQTFGFGPVAPVGCNATADGRSLNRRVEVWIRGDNEVALN
jgi:phosphate transport system substrate-binding protein